MKKETIKKLSIVTGVVTAKAWNTFMDESNISDIMEDHMFLYGVLKLGMCAMMGTAIGSFTYNLLGTFENKEDVAKSEENHEDETD